MQFFPQSTSSNVSALGGLALASGENASSAVKHSGNSNAFLDYFNKSLAASGVSPITEGFAENAAPKGFRTVKRDLSVKLDDEDISTIIKKLQKKGVQDFALTGMEGMLASNISPTLGNIIGAVAKRGRVSDDLTDKELQDLTTAFQKLGVSADEADEIMQFMNEGRGLEASRALLAKAAGMGQESVSLDKNEVLAIMRGLDISKGALEQVNALLGDGDNAIGGESLTTLLGPAREEFALIKAEEEKLAGELKEVIAEALDEKKIREATAPVADARGSKKTERAETRMRDDLTAKANHFGKGLADDEIEDFTDDEYARREDAPRDDHSRAWNQKPKEGRTVAARAGGRDEANAQTSRDAAAQTKSAVFTDKIDVASGMTAPSQSAAAAPQQPQAGALYAHRQEIFSQVEQGLLRQLQDGSRQMTLRLDPMDLGQLTVLLTVKGGEVRALIKTDNPETTSLLSEQMTQLRQSLEEQGLKVAQLDVETQLPQNAKDAWADANSFNQEQEMREQARFLQLAKLRRESGETLAHEMQDTGIREEISASGLHIVA